MKRLYIIPGLLLALLLVSGSAPAQNTDYMSEMLQAASIGAHDWGQAAEAKRNEKIDARGLDYAKISYHDLFLLGKIMTLEAGNCPHDECPLGVGEVVLNRVKSPEFPDTVSAVLTQPWQYYYPHMARRFDTALPSSRCLTLALRLLEGERRMSDCVVFHSNRLIGSYAAASYKHEGHPRLYFGASYNLGVYACD